MNFKVNYLSGLILYKQKQFNKAKERFRKALFFDRKNAECTFKLGMCYFKNEEWQKANYYINRALKIDPSKKQWEKQLKQTQKHSGIENKEYIKLFKYITQLDEKNLKALEHIKIYKDISFQDETSESIKKGIVFSASKIEFSQDGIPRIKIEQGYISANKDLIELTDEEVSTLEQQIIANTENPKLYRELALNLQKQGLWWQEIEALKKAIALDDTKADWYYRLGQSLEIMNKYNEAAQNYVKAIELKDDKADAQWYYRTGYCFETKSHDGEVNLKESKIYYAKAIAKDTKLKAKEFGIGVFHQNSGYWHKAICEYKNILEKNPFNKNIIYMIAYAYEQVHLFHNAEKYYKLALSFDNSQIHWHYRLGYSLEKQEKFEESALAYEFAAKNSTKFMAYWFYRWAYVLEKLGRYEESAIAYLHTKKDFKIEDYINIEDNEYPVEIENNEVNEEEPKISKYEKTLTSDNILINYVSKVVDQDPTNPINWYTLANSYQNIENLEGMEKAYKEALKRENIHNSNIYYNLGLIQFRLGLYKEACESLSNIKLFKTFWNDNYNNEIVSKPATRKVVLYTEYWENEPINEKAILYESYGGIWMSCSPLSIFENILNDDKFKDFTHIWVVNDTSKIDDRWKLKNVIFVSRDSDLYVKYLATSKYLIHNSSFPVYFTRRKEQLYLNTWHGTPLKYLAKDIKGNFMEHRFSTRNRLQATHMINPNEFTQNVLLDRADISNLISAKLQITGYPRNDRVINPDFEKISKIKKELGIEDNKPVVLYAPTWRGFLGTPEFEVEKIESDLEKLESSDWHFLFRGHYFAEEAMKESVKNIQVVPAHIDTSDILNFVDILVTDYSSIFFDFLPKKKPIIHYVYDLEEYEKERGLYFPMSEMPGVVCHTIEEVIIQTQEFIKNDFIPDEKYLDNLNKFCLYEDGNSTKRVIDFFFNDSKEIEIKPTNPKKLVFAGNLLDEYLYNKLEEFFDEESKKGFEIYLVIEPHAFSTNDINKTRLENLVQKGIFVINRVGRRLATVEQEWLFKSYKDDIEFLGEDAKKSLEIQYKREFMRLFGDVRFDDIVLLDKTSEFWNKIEYFNK